MPKGATSQWDFGELFPASEFRKVLSVAELTARIRNVLEAHVGSVWVSGEITNFKTQSSGHIYFTLKDASAQLSCVLFRGEAQVDRNVLGDGRKVVLRGELTVYEQRGQYQLRVLAAELHGLGALQAAFERLKQKLAAEGLFGPDRKLPLPRFPRRIGIVTSPTGAALRDVLHVIERRNPSLELFLAPCRVQGDGAAFEIAGAIQLLNQLNAQKTSGPPAGGRRSGPFLDLILVARGGGSLEDLWAFNEEPVARAIHSSSLPVVSAVGHEIDFTIADFVADFRAATPSAAAELITEGVFSSCQFLSAAGQRLAALARQRIADKEYELSHAANRLNRVHPRRKLNEWSQRLDDATARQARCVRVHVRDYQRAWRVATDRLGRLKPVLLLTQRREVLRQASQRLREQLRHAVADRQALLNTLTARLRLLGPENVLARGYSITLQAETGKVLRKAAEVRRGMRLRTRLQAGEITSQAE